MESPPAAEGTTAINRVHRHAAQVSPQNPHCIVVDIDPPTNARDVVSPNLNECVGKITVCPPSFESVETETERLVRGAVRLADILP